MEKGRREERPRKRNGKGDWNRTKQGSKGKVDEWKRMEGRECVEDKGHVKRGKINAVERSEGLECRNDSME